MNKQKVTDVEIEQQIVLLFEKLNDENCSDETIEQCEKLLVLYQRNYPVIFEAVALNYS